jgi:RNA polymerase sigma-70 factor, ECF subfamily
VKTDVRTAWEDLYRREGSRLWRALVLFTGDSEVASDAMAEAFAQGIARGTSIRRPGAWVWRAAFMIARGELSRLDARAPSLERDVEAAGSQGLVELTLVLRTLSPMQRGSIVLHYYGGYSLAETAAILGSSRSAIGVHLFRARALLRRELGGDDEG